MEIEADQVLTANLVPHEHCKGALEIRLARLMERAAMNAYCGIEGGMDLLDALMLGSEDQRDQTENLWFKSQ